MPLARLPTGAALHYEDMSPDSGRAAVILLHGMLGTARSHLGHVMDWLHERGFHVIGLTARGYGESLPKPRDFPDNFYQRDCRRPDRLYGCTPASTAAHLIGYSDGGEVALIAAGKHPARIASCIAIGAIGNFGPELRPVFQRMYPGDWITDEDKRIHGFSDAAKLHPRLGARNDPRTIDAGGDVSLEPGAT